MKFFISLAFCTVVFFGHTQEDRLTGMFWNNYANYNPSLTGFKYRHQAFLDYRSQWVNGERMPKDLLANYALHLEKLGLGFTYNHEEIGYYTNDKAALNLSYDLQLGEKTVLSIGVNGGLLLSKLEGTFLANDGSTLEADDFKTLFTLDAGISIHSEKFMLGLGSINLNQPTFVSETDSIFDYTLNTSYNTFLEYDWKLGEKFSLMPRVMIQTDLQSVTAEINAQLQYKEKYMVSFGARSDATLILGANWDVKKKIRAGYQFEYGLSDNLKAFGPSHEAVVGFIIDNK